MICAVTDRIKIAVCLLGPAAILKRFSLHYLFGYFPVVQISLGKVPLWFKTPAPLKTYSINIKNK